MIDIEEEDASVVSYGSSSNPLTKGLSLNFNSLSEDSLTLGTSQDSDGDSLGSEGSLGGAKHRQNLASLFRSGGNAVIATAKLGRVIK